MTPPAARTTAAAAPRNRSGRGGETREGEGRGSALSGLFPGARGASGSSGVVQRGDQAQQRVVDINAFRAREPPSLRPFPGHHAPSPARRPPLEPQAQLLERLLLA